MDSITKKNLLIAIIGCLTLGLAPMNPEPHIIGKLRWIAGGGEGMQLMDYLDLIMHGAPWLFLIYVLFNYFFKIVSGKSGAERDMLEKLIKNPSTLIIDVREPSEYKAGHVKNAKNIPLSQLSSRINELTKVSGPKVLYCRSGNRSGQAIKILSRSGVENLYNGGGLSDINKIIK